MRDLAFWFNAGVLIEKKFSLDPDYKILLVPPYSPPIYRIPIYDSRKVEWLEKEEKNSYPYTNILTEDVELSDVTINDETVSIGYSKRLNIVVIREPK